jgi:hypothetical protein
MLGLGASLSRLVVRPRARDGRFSPAVLFANNEPGVWYDPSQAANLDWRRNLLTFTEQFDNAAWTKRNGTISADGVLAPNGTMTADTFVENTVTGLHDFFNASPGVAIQAGTYTASAYVKPRGRTFVRFGIDGAGLPGGATFNLTTGAATSVSAGYTASAVLDDSGFWRLSLTRTFTATTVFFDLLSSDGSSQSLVGLNAAAFDVWGAQLEEGSTATEYQRISDVNTEVRERFPQATLFQDTAGTAPVTTPGQTVALMLDKSKGLTLGPELVTNGGFDTDTDWTKGTGVTISGGVASVTSLAAFSDFVRNETSTYTTGTFYEVSVDITAYTSGSIGFLWPATTSFFSGVRTHKFVVAATDSRIRLRTGDTFTGTIDNISVKELPGFHATQPTAAARPTYGIVPATGRRNLLTFTEQFDNAAWTKTSATVTANAAVAPDNTSTADKLVETASNSSHHINAPRTLYDGQHTYSVYAKAGERSALFWRLFKASNDWAVAVFDLSNGVVSQTANGSDSTFTVVSSEIESVGGGWYRCSITATSPATTTIPVIHVANAPSGLAFNGFGEMTYLGDGTSGIFIWGAQLEVGSTATAYQKVTTAFNVTEAGVESLGYLSFDGVDDWMVTPTITPGIDKAQIFAGVRKLSDAALGIAVEYSATVDTNNGAFYLAAPVAAGTANYLFRSKGTSGVNASYTNAAVAAPITNVLTGLGDIPGDRATLRVNGTQVAQNTADQGTGNYLAYPMYIGSRAGTSLRFNGHLHQLITRFGANLELAQIESTEAYVAGKTAGVDL